MKMITKTFEEIVDASLNYGSIKLYDENNEETEDLDSATKLFIKPKSWLISFHDYDNTFHIYTMQVDDDFRNWFKKVKKIINTRGFTYSVDIMGKTSRERKKKENKVKIEEDHLETEKDQKERRKIAYKIIELLSYIDIDKLIRLLDTIRDWKTKDGKKILVDRLRMTEQLLNIAFSTYLQEHGKDIHSSFKSDLREIIFENGKNVDDKVIFEKEEDYFNKLESLTNHNLLLQKIVEVMKENCSCQNCNHMKKFAKKYFAEKFGIVEASPRNMENYISSILSSYKIDDPIKSIMEKEKRQIEDILKREYLLITEEEERKKQLRENDLKNFHDVIVKIISYQNENQIKNTLDYMNQNQKKRFLNLIEEHFNENLSNRIKGMMNLDEHTKQCDIHLTSRPKDEKQFIDVLEKTHGVHIAKECRHLFSNQPLQIVPLKTIKTIAVFARAVGETDIADELEDYLAYRRNETVLPVKTAHIYKGPIDNPQKIADVCYKEGGHVVREQFENIMKGEPLEKQSLKSLRLIAKICEDHREVYLSSYIERFLSEKENEAL